MRLQFKEHWVFNAEKMGWPSKYPSISPDDIAKIQPSSMNEDRNYPKEKVRKILKVCTESASSCTWLSRTVAVSPD